MRDSVTARVLYFVVPTTVMARRETRDAAHAATGLCMIIIAAVHLRAPIVWA